MIIVISNNQKDFLFFNIQSIITTSSESLCKTCGMEFEDKKHLEN